MESKQVSRFELEEYLCGVLTDNAARELEERIAQSEQARQMLTTLEEEKNSFLSQNPFTDQHFSEKKQESKAPVRVFYAIAALVLISISLSIYYPRRDQKTYRTKGKTDISLYVLNAEGAIEKRTDGVYYPQERIQITYSCSENNYFMLFSTDTTGAVTTFYPASGDSSVVLTPGANLPLPNSIILDDYTGKEMYIAVFSPRALRKASVLAQIEKISGHSPDFNTLHRELRITEPALIQTIVITKKAAQQ